MQYFTVVVLLFVGLIRATPITPLASTGLHACSVFIQRWYDNSFDVYDYASGANSQAFQNWDYVITVESVSLSAPAQLPVSTIGSKQLVITDVADPVNNNDAGKLSFVWGNQKWNSWGAGSPCTNAPVGDVGAKQGAPTTTTCSFQCDA